MTVYGPLLHNERNYLVFIKVIINIKFFNKQAKVKKGDTLFERSSEKTNEKTSPYSTNFRIKTKQHVERKRTASAFVDTLEINPEKYINHDQKYLNSINNNIIKMKMQALIDLETKKGSFIYW